jgi:hypothetical protein
VLDGRRVVERDEETILVVVDDFRIPADVRRDDRHAGGHRLEHDVDSPS